jgi:phospholipid-binding lipoprotein MlaA
LTACASTEKREEITAETTPSVETRVDPYEGFNRSMYSFNMGVDRYVLKPVADGYRFVTPDFMETGVRNFFTNLKGINVVFNDVLQGKFKQGASDTGRFLTNTTIGVAGLFDVASEFGLENNVEDFGQTLAVWGVDEGPYLVLPLLGPTTIRDGGAGIMDRAANPGTYVPFTGVIEGISDRANAQGALNFIDEAALDPYVFTRESFLQYRRSLVSDGKNDSRVDVDLDAAIDDLADPNEAKTNEAIPADAVKSDSGNGTPSAVKPSEITASKGSAFDGMLQSFEQTSHKMDQLSNTR